MAVAAAHRDEQNVYLALAEVPLRAVQAQAQLARARQQAHQQHSQGQVIQVDLAKKVLDARLVRGQFCAVVEMLRHFAKWYVSTFEEPQHEAGNELLAGQVPHQRGRMQKGRNFGNEAVLHGKGRFWQLRNYKGRTFPFLCAIFSRVE